MFKKIIYSILIILALLEINHVNNELYLITKTLEEINSNWDRQQGTWSDDQHFTT